jgi:IMP dehydrogenase
LISELGGMAILHRFMTIEKNVEMFNKLKHKEKVGISIGIGKDGMERAEALIKAGCSIICVDVAHGHSKEVNCTVRFMLFKVFIVVVEITPFTVDTRELDASAV